MGQAGESTQATLDMPLIRINYKYTSAGVLVHHRATRPLPPAACGFVPMVGVPCVSIQLTLLKLKTTMFHNFYQFQPFPRFTFIELDSSSHALCASGFSDSVLARVLDGSRTHGVCEASARPCARLQAQVLRLASQISPRLIRYR